jgi:hypothetical protein
MSFGRRTGGYVYLFAHEHGFVKIGASDNPSKRLSNIRGSTPYEVFLKTRIRVYGEREFVEGILHDIYDQYHVSHEWFDLPDDAVEQLTQINKLHTATVETCPNWTPEKHLSLSDVELSEYRGLEDSHEVQKQARKMASLINTDKFPRDNLTTDNAAVKTRAKRVQISPTDFVDQVERILDNDVYEPDTDSQEAIDR